MNKIGVSPESFNPNNEDKMSTFLTPDLSEFRTCEVPVVLGPDLSSPSGNPMFGTRKRQQGFRSQLSLTQ